MLCGIPTSGKSTYVQKHLLESELCDSYVLLSTDAYIEKRAVENNVSYNEAFEEFISEAETRMYFDLECALRDSKSIVWDQTNLTPKVRKRKASRIPSSYNKIVVWFDVSLEDAMIRNQQRPGKVIPGSVLKRMYHTFTPPSELEGFNQIIKGN
jgi:predicted kinase